MNPIVHKIIQKNGPFPNNPKLPLLLYKQALETQDPERALQIFAENGWKHSWINGIYRYHHFHSNTHEALGIVRGTCEVQIGGVGGVILDIQAKDLLIIPAGVSHKNIGASKDFSCVGTYPIDIQYDIHEGKPTELLEVEQNIANVPLPDKDPIYGKEGPLLQYWI